MTEERKANICTCTGMRMALMVEMRKCIKKRANSSNEDVDKDEHMDWNEDG
jgi:hypothetical protein